MDVRDSASVNTPSVRSRKHRLVPIRVLTNSQRGSVDFTSSANSSKQDIVNLARKVADHSNNCSRISSDHKAETKSQSKHIAGDQVDPTRCKKARFGDSRPVVRDVWIHYPVQEVPSCPKQIKEPLNKILNRKSVFAPKLCEDLDYRSIRSVSSSNEELELEDDCRFEMHRPTTGNRSTSANAKIDSYTKLKAVEDIENNQFGRAKREGLDIARHIRQQEDVSYKACSDGRFPKAAGDSPPSKNSFKISSITLPKGLMDNKMWKKAPASPHIENHVVQSVEYHARRRSVLSPLSPDDSPQGKSSLHNGVEHRHRSKDKQFEIKLSDASKPHFELQSKLEASGLTKSNSVKVVQRSRVPFYPQLPGQQTHELHGFSNWVDFASKRSSVRGGNDFGALAPFIKDSCEMAHESTDGTPGQDQDQSKPKRKASRMQLPHIDRRRLVQEEMFGLNRRVSISSKKAAKKDVGGSMSNCQTKGTTTDGSPIEKIKI